MWDKLLLSNTRSDFDPRKKNLFLYASNPFVILYQYYFGAQLNILNYGTIIACLKKDSDYRWDIRRGQQHV